MKRLIIFVAALVAGVAIAATYYPQRLQWDMVSCPSGARGRVDENGTAVCQPAQSCSVGTCTGTPPAASTDGMSLLGLSAFRLTVCAPATYAYSDGGTVLYTDGGAVIATQRLSGAGKLDAYVYQVGKNAWSRDPSLDQNIAVTSSSCNGSGCACEAFPDLSVGGSFDRVKFVADGVTLHLTDGGTNDAGVEVLVDGQTTSR